MLENASVEDLQRLLNATGVSKKELSISETETGDIVRVDTVSGNIYFFETTSAHDFTAFVFRCDARLRAPQAGFRGERKISAIKEGECVFHNRSNTSPVSNITLIQKPN